MLSYLHMAAPAGHEIYMDDAHRWRAPGPGDIRSPCPALNTLANHGYIARDGKGLTFVDLVQKQCEVFNMSYVLAASLAFEAVFLCGNGRTVDMHQLRKHNVIEHDASLAHDDISTGDSWTPDRQLIANMILPDEDKTGLTFTDIARVRVAREKLIAGRRLDFVHNRIALGEACLVVAVWGTGGGDDFTKNIVSHQRIRSFFVDERLPPDWFTPTRSLGFLKTVELGGQLRAIMDKMIAAEKDVDEAADIVDVDARSDSSLSTKVGGQSPLPPKSILVGWK